MTAWKEIVVLTSFAVTPVFFEVNLARFVATVFIRQYVLTTVGKIDATKNDHRSNLQRSLYSMTIAAS